MINEMVNAGITEIPNSLKIALIGLAEKIEKNELIDIYKELGDCAQELARISTMSVQDAADLIMRLISRPEQQIIVIDDMATKALNPFIEAPTNNKELDQQNFIKRKFNKGRAKWQR